MGADILEAGDWVGGREEVVRWVRRFPFHFLTGGWCEGCGGWEAT